MNDLDLLASLPSPHNLWLERVRILLGHDGPMLLINNSLNFCNCYWIIKVFIAPWEPPWQHTPVEPCLNAPALLCLLDTEKFILDQVGFHWDSLVKPNLTTHQLFSNFLGGVKNHPVLPQSPLLDSYVDVTASWTTTMMTYTMMMTTMTKMMTDEDNYHDDDNHRWSWSYQCPGAPWPQGGRSGPSLGRCWSGTCSCLRPQRSPWEIICFIYLYNILYIILSWFAPD